MARPYETVLQRWFEEVWDQGSEAAIDELMAEDAIVHGIAGPDGREIRGPAGFRPFSHHFHTAFPDIRTTIEDALEDGDRIAVRRAVIASHTRPGAMGTPTDQTESFTGICIARVKDGRIAEGCNNIDFLSLCQQLGMQLS